mmetsp:Transcript_23281/g.61337  ORF Transcript_23281/g.61337 Transcript_23281/m.61337 type:complete len:204 (-) Transcript_23281:312-923(-)
MRLRRGSCGSGRCAADRGNGRGAQGALGPHPLGSKVCHLLPTGNSPVAAVAQRRHRTWGRRRCRHHPLRPAGGATSSHKVVVGEPADARRPGASGACLVRRLAVSAAIPTACEHASGLRSTSAFSKTRGRQHGPLARGQSDGCCSARQAEEGVAKQQVAGKKKPMPHHTETTSPPTSPAAQRISGGPVARHHIVPRILRSHPS